MEAQLATLKAQNLKKADEVKKIAKDLLEGETATLTCHLLESENHLGRSLVIDLNAPLTNNVR